MLHGLRVLDLTFYLPGPYATLFLADLGAEVIKIENPAGGDPLRRLGPEGGTPSGSVFFRAVNRNKKSVTLDLKTPEGRDLFLRLAATADAVIEQFRPGVAARLGVDHRAVRERNPRLTYVSLSGYGQTGPLAGEAGHDINYMAQSGLLSLFAESSEMEAGRLPLPPVQLADLNGGNLAAIALLTGMLSARLTGRGSYIDVSMTDGLLSLMALTVSNHLAGGGEPVRENLFLTGGEPQYNVYQTADGRFLSVGALEPKFWLNLCQVLARVDPEGRPAEAIARSREETARVFARKTAAEWMSLLEGLDVCVRPVLTVAEALKDPYVRERGMVVEVDGLRQVRLPFFPASWEPLARPAPRLGEHNRQTLSSLGVGEAQLQELAGRGVISCEPTSKRARGGTTDA
ncbi:MAG TPA: carnitine dehydratase [Clostridiales bacterium]|nr:carnitine dehydratase [Clostridiales bacterium]